MLDAQYTHDPETGEYYYKGKYYCSMEELEEAMAEYEHQKYLYLESLMEK